MFFFFFSSRRRHTRCALVTGVQTCALPIFTALNSRFTYIPVGFEGRSAVGNTALGSALLANAGQQNTEPGPGATEGLVFGDRFPLSIGNERQTLSLSPDRTSVGEGKRGSVSVDLGGGRTIKKNKKIRHKHKKT